jgi:hypothetical protein
MEKKNYAPKDYHGSIAMTTIPEYEPLPYDQWNGRFSKHDQYNWDFNDSLDSYRQAAKWSGKF